MKTLLITLAMLLSTAAIAEQTTTEVVDAKARDAKAAAKKTVNRTKEMVCMEGDAKCAAEKAKNRMNEAAEATANKAKEVKDKVD